MTNRTSLAPPPWRRWRIQAADRKRRQREAPHRLEFQRFYDGLPNKQNPFYMFFSSGLLHWAVKTLQFVPPHVNVVLIGTNLTAEEVGYLTAYVQRPFHIVSARVWDTTVWEWLFEINEGNFGWLDVDCLVLNPDLFGEMVHLDERAALNGCWRSYQGWGFLATYLLFVNVRVLRDIRARVEGISPRMYHPWWDSRPQAGYANLLREADRLAVAPTGSPKLGFDTTQFYQLAAEACGYYLHSVRHLHNDPQFDNFCSEELLHMTGASWYRDHYLRADNPFTHDLVVRAVFDYLLLRDSDKRLPASYAGLKNLIGRMLGGQPMLLRRHVHAFLGQRGFSERAFATPGLEFLQYSPAPREI